MLFYIAKYGFYYTRRTLLSDSYTGLLTRMRPGNRVLLMLESEQYFAIVTREENGYIVSILKEPKQHKDSYVEVNVTESHPMYERVHNVCSILSISGAGIEVDGVGEAYETGLYKIILTEEENEGLQKA